jgi:hypothetical protein
LTHTDSLLWVDIVDRGPIFDTQAFPKEVQNFMHGMQVLGEPFTFGSDLPEDFIESLGLRCLEVVTSDVFFPDSADPIYSIYQFCTISGGSANGTSPRTFRPTAISHSTASILKPHFSLPFNGVPQATQSAAETRN